MDLDAEHELLDSQDALNEKKNKPSLRVDVAIQVKPLDLDGPAGTPYRVAATFDWPVKTPNTRLQKYSDVADELAKAASRALVERRTKYNNVRVITICWDGGEYQEMKKNADLIGEVFKDTFNYTVQPVVLPAENPDSHLFGVLGAASTLSRARETNLLIVYYCGHGVWDRHGRRLKPHKNATIQLDWDDFQSMLRKLDCDILLIFDCCQATAMIERNQKWKRRCEILGAVNTQDMALADEDKSFTNALVKELRKCGTEGVAIDALYNTLSDMKVMNDYNMKRQPDYYKHSDPKTGPCSVFLRPRSLTDGTSNGDDNHEEDRIRSPEEVANRSDAMMLFAVFLEGSQATPRPGDWRDVVNSFSTAPPNVSAIEVSAIPTESYVTLMKLVKISAVHRGSCVMIIAMPVWLYAHLEPNPSYHAIGIVRSDNLWFEVSEVPTASSLSKVESPLASMVDDLHREMDVLMRRPHVAATLKVIPGQRLSLKMKLTDEESTEAVTQTERKGKANDALDQETQSRSQPPKATLRVDEFQITPSTSRWQDVVTEGDAPIGGLLRASTKHQALPASSFDLVLASRPMPPTRSDLRRIFPPSIRRLTFSKTPEELSRMVAYDTRHRKKLPSFADQHSTALPMPLPVY